MSWRAQSRSKDAKTPSVAGGRSEKPELDLRPVQQYLKYALGRQTNRQKPPVLVEVTAEGTKVYGGKQRVEAKEKELTEEHFGKNRERWCRNA
jgi:hypothetical protein